MVKWIDQNYFNPDLKLRKVSRGGAGAWTELQYVLADIKREAALTILPTNNAPSAQHVAPVVPLVVPRPAPPAARPPPPPPPLPPHSPAAYSDTGGYSGGRGAFSEAPPGRGGRGGGRYGGRGRGGGPGPFTPDEGAVDYDQQGGFSGGRGRGGGRFQEYPSGGRFDRGRGRGGSFEGRGGRFDRGGRRGGGRFDRGGGRGGRGGRGGGPGDAELEVASAVSRLFHGEVSQGAEQPMWRYIDPEGRMQGPFPAKDMESWFQEGYLADPGLRVCGTERKVAPPNLPPPEFFIPLGALIYWVRRGHKFSPIMVADVLAKKLPEELQKLKDGAERIAEKKTAEKNSKEGSTTAAAPAPAGVESAGSAADDSHSEAEEGAEAEVEEEDTQQLAARMVQLAVDHVLEEDDNGKVEDAVSAVSSTGEN